MNWIIGTLILWVLKAITVPFARAFAGQNITVTSPPPAVPPAVTPEDAPQQAAQPKPVNPEDLIPTGYYILADVIVLGGAGLLLGLLTGYYFIGISWRGKDWPGMIVFIVASLFGSAMHR